MGKESEGEGREGEREGEREGMGKERGGGRGERGGGTGLERGERENLCMLRCPLGLPHSPLFVGEAHAW